MKRSQHYFANAVVSVEERSDDEKRHEQPQAMQQRPCRNDPADPSHHGRTARPSVAAFTSPACDRPTSIHKASNGIQLENLPVMFFGGLMLTWPSSSLAITAQDYIGIRILEPADIPAPEDLGLCVPADVVEGGLPCTGIGPAYGAGISDAGDVFGNYMTNEAQDQVDFAEGIRWLRRDGYKGENMGKYPLDPCP